MHLKNVNGVVVALGAAVSVALNTMAVAQERVTPFEWQDKLEAFDRDANGNFVEDSLEQIASRSVLGVSAIVALNKCLTFDELQRFEDYGDVAYVSKTITAITIKNIDTTRLEELANEPEVSFVFEDKAISGFLDLSVPSAQVTGSTEYSPSTLVEKYPDIFQNASNIGVAIIDSGVDDAHEDIPAPIGFFDAISGLQVNPPDGTGHGTNVAGIALSRNDTWRGVCPTCQLVDVRVLDASGNGTSTQLIQGLEFVFNHRFDLNIRVANLSLGAATSSDGLDPQSQVVNRLSRAGIIVVAAAGNAGSEIIPSPAAADEAFVVSAMDDNNSIDRSAHTFAGYSNFGPRPSDNDSIVSDERKPDISAPGTWIAAPQAGTTSGISQFRGTSQATPHVSGFMALLAGMRPGITPRSVREIIHAQGSTWNAQTGFGELNAFQLIELANQQIATDLGFEQHCGTSYRPVSLMPANEPIFFEQANQVRATVTNYGANTSGEATAKIGLYKFGNSPQSWDICESTVPGLAPGDTFEVVCNWTPQYAGHACLKADLAYENDTDYANNCAQRNVDIGVVPFGQSKKFLAQVTHDNPNTTLIKTTAIASNTDWDVDIPEEFQQFYMYPSECPRQVEINVTPNIENAQPVVIDVSFDFEQPNWPDDRAVVRPLHGISIMVSVE